MGLVMEIGDGRVKGNGVLCRTVWIRMPPGGIREIYIPHCTAHLRNVLCFCIGEDTGRSCTSGLLELPG